MAVLPIVTGENTAVLRAVAAQIPQVTKDVKKLISSMRDTVKEAEGLGIAAPQVGVSQSLCLALFNSKMTAMINPVITWKSEETSVMEEGCLSLPKQNIDVPRSVEILVKYTDEQGNNQERRLHDLDARVVQHEVDHLNGVLIVDYK